MTDKKILYLVGTQIDSARDKKYNDWYNSTHLPLNFECQSVDKITRYKLLPESEGNDAQYIALFEFKDRQAFDNWQFGPEREAAREDSKKVWDGKGAEVKWKAAYEVINSWTR